jgi:PAS domain S-box-containing protein
MEPPIKSMSSNDARASNLEAALSEEQRQTLERIDSEILGRVYLRDRQSTLDHFVRYAHDLLQVESSAIFLVPDSEPKTLVLDASFTDRFKHSFQRDVQLLIFSSPGHGLTAHIAKQQQLFRAHGVDLWNNPFIARRDMKHAHLESQLCFSVLAVPLLDSGSNLLGLLKFENKKGPDGIPGDAVAFDVEDETLAEALRKRAILLIESIQRFEAFTGSDEPVRKALTREDLLAQCLEVAKHWCGFDSGIVYSADNANKVLRCQALLGCEPLGIQPSEFKYRFDEKSIATKVFRDKEAFATENPWTSDEANRLGLTRFQITGPIAALPLMVGAMPVGVLVLWNPRPGVSVTSDTRSRETVAKLIASYIIRFAYERSVDAAYHSLLEPLPFGIFRKDRQKRIRFCNQHYSEVVGKPIAEILGKTDNELFPPDLAEKFMADDETVMTTGKEFEDVERNRDANGRPIYVHVFKKPVWDSEGNLIGLFGIFMDVTKPKLFEQQADAQKIAKLGSWEWDMEEDRLSGSDELFRIFEVNPAERLDYARDFIGKVHTEDRNIVERVTLDVHRSPQKFDTEFRIARQDKSIRILHAKGEPVHDSKGRTIKMRGTIQDVTERKQVEAQAIQSEKFQSIGKLASQLAHDMRSPLATIKLGVANLMKRLHESPADGASQILSDIKHAADYTLNVIQLLLDLSAEKKRAITSVNMNEKLSEVLLLVNRRCNSGRIGVNTEWGSDLPVVSVDVTQISILLLNVLENAIEAMPDGGAINIRTRSEPTAQDRNADSYRMLTMYDTWVVVEVEDTGEGISQDILERVFELGFTTKRQNRDLRSGGSGLGLYSCRRIMEFHDGQIEITSRGQGMGTTVIIKFPALRI